MPTSDAVDVAPSRATELPSGRERLAVLALAAAAFALNLNTNVLGALLPFLGPVLDLDADGKGLLIGVGGGGSAVGALLVGFLGSRFPLRSTLLAGLLAFCVTSLVQPLCSTLATFAVVRALAACSVGIAYAAASVLVADLVPYTRRSAAMGRFNAGLFLAVPIGLPATVLLARAGSWRMVFVLQAGVALLAGWMALRVVPGSAGRRASGTTFAVLRHRGVAAGLLATMLHVGTFFTVVQLATSWLDESGLVPKEQQMWLWVALGALSVAGSAGFARLADRVGKRPFVLLASALLVVGFFALTRDPAPLPLLGIAGVVAVAAAARTGPLQALLSGLVPSGQLGALMGLRGFGMQLGVFGFAMLATRTPAGSSFRGVLLLAAGCQLLSYLLIRFGVHEPPAVEPGATPRR